MAFEFCCQTINQKSSSVFSLGAYDCENKVSFLFQLQTGTILFESMHSVNLKQVSTAGFTQNKSTSWFSPLTASKANALAVENWIRYSRSIITLLQLAGLITCHISPKRSAALCGLTSWKQRFVHCKKKLLVWAPITSQMMASHAWIPNAS